MMKKTDTPANRRGDYPAYTKMMKASYRRWAEGDVATHGHYARS
jgi:hypothetical protein